jgi:uncharacterized protein
VLIVVGGPQYRVGSHRQFVLLARRLAHQGFATLRFDYRGMGDSEGAMRHFEAVGPDVHAALDALCQACPAVKRVVVWGLCDAASAALMFATAHPRVAGIVAANPWVRSEATLAAARMKHYYGRRLLQRDFWDKLLHGGVNWRGSAHALAHNLQGAWGRKAPVASAQVVFQTAMARGLAAWRGSLLLLLSGQDITAQEFVQYTDSAPEWRGLLARPHVHCVKLPQADHTFSRRVWHTAMEDETLAWLQQLEQKNTSTSHLSEHT